MSGRTARIVAWSWIVGVSVLWGAALAAPAAPDCACPDEGSCLCDHAAQAPACHAARADAAGGLASCSLRAARPSAELELALLPTLLPGPVRGLEPGPGIAPAGDLPIPSALGSVRALEHEPEPHPPRPVG